MLTRTYFNKSRAMPDTRSARLGQSSKFDAGRPSPAPSSGHRAGIFRSTPPREIGLRPPRFDGRRDTRGVVAVEYVVIVGSLALLAIPAALAVGKALVESFGVTREMLFFPIP